MDLRAEVTVICKDTARDDPWKQMEWLQRVLSSPGDTGGALFSAKSTSVTRGRRVPSTNSALMGFQILKPCH